MSAETFFCSDCGNTFPIKGVTSPGYAVTRDEKKICYDCATKRDILELKDRSKPFCAYVSSDSKTITNWPGRQLMTVTHSEPCKLTRQSFTHDRKSYRSIWAKDVHGGMWYGRGSASILIKLRPIK